MENTICNDFASYLQAAENIFDIMAAAYKLLRPVDPNQGLIEDDELKKIILKFVKNNNDEAALITIKQDLTNWIRTLNKTDKEEIRKRLLCLVRMIDIKCVEYAKSYLPEPYRQYFSLNMLLQDEIIIVPRRKNTVADLMTKAIIEKEGHKLYGRNQSRTRGISRFIHNFIMCRKDPEIKPSIHIPMYYKELRDEFEQKNHKLVVAVFPLTNVNLRELFHVYEKTDGTNGIFGIESPVVDRENNLLERCKKALEICREYGVDIAVFPEMLFTDKNQKEIMDYVRDNEDSEKRFPWFMWLGTAWSQNENKCMVIDRYGKEVFTQKKEVPYEYKDKIDETITEINAADNEKKDERITFIEDLVHDSEWIVHFLDIPDFIRIATAICRDISDDHLKIMFKQFLSDLVIIPAYSNTERLNRHIEFMVKDQVHVLVCNSCSANCKKGQERYEINTDLIGKAQSFCYVCMASKKSGDNITDFREARYIEKCMQCDKYCNGFIWEISFTECAVRQDKYSVKVSELTS